MRNLWSRKVILLIVAVMFLSVVVSSYAEKEIDWIMFTGGTGVSWADKQWKDVIIPDIERITNGRLKIDLLYHGEYPYKDADLLRVVSEGTADLVSGWVANWSGTEPRLTVVDMPMFVPSYPGDLQRVYHRILDEVLKDVFAKWNCHELLTTWMGAQHFYLSDFWIEDFDSLKGKKIRTFNAELDDLVKLLNGTPVRVDAAEVYTALQTGVADGLITGVSNGHDNMYFEVVPNMEATFICDCTAPVYINDDSWNELPEDIRNTLQNYFDSKRDWYEMGQTLQNGLDLIDSFPKFRLKVYTMPEELRKEIVKKSYEAIWEPWIKRCGEGGEKVFEGVADILIDEGFEVPTYK